jgi:hypothetical protein
MEEPNGWDSAKPLASRTERSILLDAGSLPRNPVGKDHLNVRWDTPIAATESGNYDLGVKADGYFFVTLNEEQRVTFRFAGSSLRTVFPKPVPGISHFDDAAAVRLNVLAADYPARSRPVRLSRKLRKRRSVTAGLGRGLRIGLFVPSPVLRSAITTLSSKWRTCPTTGSKA